MGVGLLISFEGGEGVGKGTQVRLLMEALLANGREVVLTREPGGTDVGEKIRYLLKHDADGKNMRNQTELILFIAARAQNYFERIAPALERGAVVICDRFIDSSMVYQGMGRGLGMEPVAWLNNYATAGRKPDITFLLDVPVSVGFERVGKRAPEVQLPLAIKGVTPETAPLHDRIEDAGETFFETVRQGYLNLAKQEPKRFAVIDASGTDPKLIAKEVWEYVKNYLA